MDNELYLEIFQHTWDLSELFCICCHFQRLRAAEDKQGGQ